MTLKPESTPDLIPASVTIVPTSVGSTNLGTKPGPNSTSAVPSVVAPANTLGALIDQDQMAKLTLLTKQMMEALVPDSVTAAQAFQQFEETSETFTCFKENMTSFLTKVKSAESFDEAKSKAILDVVDNVVGVFDSIADSHPILKVAWFVVSAGYKMAKTYSEVDQSFQTLVEHVVKASKEIGRVLSLQVTGIPKDTQLLFKDSLDSYMGCLVDAVKLYLDHLDEKHNTAAQAKSLFFGSDTKILDAINSRLTSAQQALQHVKDDGLLEITVFIASNVVQIEQTTSETHQDVVEIKQLLTAVAVHQPKSDISTLRGLCKFTRVHSSQDILALCDRRNPNTRGWMIDQLSASLLDPAQEEHIFWLRGEAGTGKSVLAGCVAAVLKSKKLLGAAFFCQHDNKERDSISVVIQTLAYELALFEPKFCSSLIQSLLDSKFKDMVQPKVKTLLDIFLITPLQAWPQERPVTILIDALDELVDPQEHINLVLEAFQSLHGPVHLLVTSRPNVVPTSKGQSQYKIQEFDVDSAGNKKDILTFTQDRLSAMLPAVNKARLQLLANQLSEASNGLFIWIVLVLGDVSAADVGKFNVSEGSQKKFLLKGVKAFFLKTAVGGNEADEALIVQLEQSAAVLDLNALYCRALQKACHTEDSMDERASLLKISVGLLLVAKVPISAESSGQLAVLGHEDLDDYDVEESLASIQSLWKCDASGKISFIHKTVTEYLKCIKCHTSCNSMVQCPSKSKAIFCCHNQSSQLLQIDLNMASLDLALASLAFLNSDSSVSGLSQNMAGLSVSEDSPSWPSDTMSELLSYTVSYWADHFADSFLQNPDHQDTLLTALQDFCSSKLPFYLEALLLLNKINDVFRVVGLVNTCLEAVESPSATFIKSILQDLKSVAYNFRPQLLLNPLQVYNHALVAVPHGTEYFKKYNHLAPAKLVIGSTSTWGPLTLSGHTQNVISVAASSNGQTVVSGCEDGSIKVWSVANGECTGTLEGHTEDVCSVALSLDGRMVVSGSRDHTVKVWSVLKGVSTATLCGHTSFVNSVVMASNGETVVSGSDDETVRVWAVLDGRCVATFVGHTGAVTSVAISGDGKTVASGSDDRTVRVWSVKDGKCFKTLEGHTQQVKGVDVSYDGSTVVSGSLDSKAKLWSVVDGRCLHTFSGHGGPVKSVALSRDGGKVVTGSYDQSIKVWFTESGECMNTFAGHMNWVSAIALCSEDGSTVVSGSFDKTVKIWDVSTGGGDSQFHSELVYESAISLDGSSVASGSFDKTVKLWSTSTGECVQILVGHTSWVTSVALSFDGTMVVSGSLDGSVKLWSASSAKCLHTYSAGQKGVLAVDMSFDGAVVVSASIDGKARVWSGVDGKCVCTLDGHTGSVNSVALSLDGLTVVSGSDDHSIRLWSVLGGACISMFQGHAEWVVQVAMSLD
ncbi:hypothetical protein HDU98_008798, partial [Podochytrium sp. JEL0797]